MSSLVFESLPVICLAGPTCVGKTSLAIKIAKLCDGEIINTDSRQVYRDFPIICAQPTAYEQQECPHHLYGFLDTQEHISAGEWRAKAAAKIVEILKRKHVPLLVGGTGMYFQALLHGIAPIPKIDANLRQELEERVNSEGVLALYAELEKKDYAYAQKIHPHDRQRIVRALEVLAQTGETFSAWHAKTGQNMPKCHGPLYVIKVDLAWLEPRLKLRIEHMLANGAIEEAKLALTNCQDISAPGWSGIGCAEILAYIQGRITLTECLDLWQHNTRAYAKRQNTWFRARKEAIFFDIEHKDEIIAYAEKFWRQVEF